MNLIATLIVNDTQYNENREKTLLTLCWVPQFLIVMLNVVRLSVITLNVVFLSVVASPGEPLQPSLMFVGKSGTYQGGKNSAYEHLSDASQWV
jgi:hypothetical protein